MGLILFAAQVFYYYGVICGRVLGELGLARMFFGV